jgi:predicted alpha/beta hydrolase
MDSEKVSISTADGGTIAALLFPAQAPRALVLLHPATAVTQGYYEAFARWLAGLGLSVLTYARLERRQIAPRDAGVPAIGHMGFFRKRCAALLWPQVGDWLLAQVAGHRAAAGTGAQR